MREGISVTNHTNTVISLSVQMYSTSKQWVSSGDDPTLTSTVPSTTIGDDTDCAYTKIPTQKHSLKLYVKNNNQMYKISSFLNRFRSQIADDKMQNKPNIFDIKNN